MQLVRSLLSNHKAPWLRIDPRLCRDLNICVTFISAIDHTAFHPFNTTENGDFRLHGQLVKEFKNLIILCFFSLFERICRTYNFKTICKTVGEVGVKNNCVEYLRRKLEIRWPQKTRSAGLWQ